MNQKKKKIFMIGNTHFDPVWLWRWEDAMASIHATFRSALDRMNEDEAFIYSFATPPVFEWIKKTDPDMFEEIKVRVEEGRWDVCEGWYLQPDCFSALGESYARQSLYGQRYLLENFGKMSDTVFNIDSFGHHSQTPQILKKSGMKYYCLCRPEEHHVHLDAPLFSWIGKDGSEVTAFRAGQYSPIYNKDMPATIEGALTSMEGAPCDEMMVYGVTDHGGAPTKQAIADIHALNKSGVAEGIFSTVNRFFEEQSTPVVKYHGELLTGDFGPYVNHSRFKKLHRYAENAVLNAEKASIIAKRFLDRPYPSEVLDAAWRDVMFCQFHDILGGASIKEAYFDAANMLGRAITNAEEIVHFSLGAMTRKIKMPGENPRDQWNLCVWNLNPDVFDGYVEAEVQWLHEFPAYCGNIEIEDTAGKRYPCQVITEGSVIKGFRTRFVFKTEIDGLGYKTFRVIQTGGEACISDHIFEPCIRLDNFDVEFDADRGLIKRIYSKKLGKEFKDPISLLFLQDEGDTWAFNVDGYQGSIEGLSFEGFAVTEKGIHRTTIKTTHKFLESKIELYYTFYHAEDYFDVNYRVNWNEKHIVLKLMFNTEYENLLVSSPFASEMRTSDKHDRPMSDWLAVFGEEGGLSLVSDGVFAYNFADNKIGLTLLRSCIYGDLRLSDLDERIDYPIMDRGIIDGRVRIGAFVGKPSGRIAKSSDAFINSPKVVVESNHGGVFAGQSSFIIMHSENTLVSAVKKAYDDDGEIIRLYEKFGKADTVSLSYFGTDFAFDLSPYEIKTLKLIDGQIQEINITETEKYN